MSPYFFHVKLELYPHPAPAADKRRKRDHYSSRSKTPFVPPPGADIFHTSLPTHKRRELSKRAFTRPPGSPSSKYSEDSDNSATNAQGHGDHHHHEHYGESHGDALLLPERTLSHHTAIAKSPVRSSVKPSNEAAARDWRYDAVSIESIDMDSRTSKNGRTKTANNGLLTKAVYSPSESSTTEVGWGIVHLYRDNEESPSLTDTEVSRKSLDQARSSISHSLNADECTTLCILAVPSWMMPSDLLGFVGDQAREDVSHFRLVRTDRANKYMVLMKFRSAKKAREWQRAYNGRLFSAAEPENCHVVFIKSVEFMSSSTAPANADDTAITFPHNNHHDPFTPAGTTAKGWNNSLTNKPFAPPPPNLLELPTCPVCLERMDETSGLLTILCQHVFHCACLEKWRFQGSGCPVCRYTQNPSYTFPYPRPQGGEQTESEALCSVCAADVNLWICLICGNIGCGRYDSAHAYAHYEMTSHCYAMDIDTQRVWDYAGDGYVHRLIQSKPFATSDTGPKVSAEPHGTVPRSEERIYRHENEAFRAEGSDMVPREKMESMANEYTYLLTSQLEGQRLYFEEQVERAVDKASTASARAEEAAAEAEAARRSSVAHSEAQQVMSEDVSRLEKQLEKSEKARGRFEQLARELSSSLREEKAMNEGLLKRVQAADEKAKAMEVEVKGVKDEVAELQEMNRDLTMFISSQERVRELQAQGEEVVDGSISLPEQQQKTAKKGKGKKK